MNEKRSELDADELLMLAVRAIRRKESKQAMEYAKRARQAAPHNAQVHHILGGLHASKGEYTLAIDALNRALELDAQHTVARFQLGLLHFTFGRIPEASATWAPLETLGEDHPLHLFKRGMLHLSSGKFTQCVDDIERGIRINTENPSLNRDMHKVVARARRAMA